MGEPLKITCKVQNLRNLECCYLILRGKGERTEARFFSVMRSFNAMLFSYFFVVGNIMEIRAYTFQYRVSYDDIFRTHIINLTTDIFIILLSPVACIYLSVIDLYKKIPLIIFFSIFVALTFLNVIPASQIGAVLSVPIILCLISIDRFWYKRILNHDASLILRYIILSAILLAISGITRLLVFVTTGVNPISVERYTYTIYQQLLSNLSTIFMTGIIFSIQLKVLVNELVNKLKFNPRLLLIDTSGEKLQTKQVAIYLSLSAILRICVALTSHLVTTKPNGQQIGVDSALYAKVLK
jgi:hypothetical protein